MESTNTSVTALLGIDWRLLVAQLINFAIVLFVLYKWVFKPLGKKMEQRTRKIEQSLEHAKEVEQKLKDAEAYRQAEMEKVRAEANATIYETQKNAEKLREELKKNAQDEAEKMLLAAKKEIDAEKVKMLQEVREEAATLVVAATERILREKIDEKKDAQLIKESLKNI